MPQTLAQLHLTVLQAVRMKSHDGEPFQHQATWGCCTTTSASLKSTVLDKVHQHFDLEAESTWLLQRRQWLLFLSVKKDSLVFDWQSWSQSQRKCRSLSHCKGESMCAIHAATKQTKVTDLYERGYLKSKKSAALWFTSPPPNIQYSPCFQTFVHLLPWSPCQQHSFSPQVATQIISFQAKGTSFLHSSQHLLIQH